MPVITVRTGDGTEYRLHAESGENLLQVLERGSFVPDAPCGGRGACGKCRVYAKGELSPPVLAEKDFLKEEGLKRGLRLACCCTVEGDAFVRPVHEESCLRIQTEGEEARFSEDPLFSEYGIAIDIGTTTLAAALYGREGLLSRSAALNPQSVFGADVITRIEKALGGKGEELRESIRSGLTELILDAAKSAGISAGSIDAAVITGNTTMLYLLTGRDPGCLSHAPFAADDLFGRFEDAKELGLSCIKKARVYLPRCVSAFVGADITTAILAAGLTDSPETALLADIGTNGELVLKKGDSLLCTSTAAGPVFEGAFLSCGMQGKQGAIDHVSWTGEELRVHVIGEGKAEGICGSGIIDAAAAFIDGGLIEESGLIADEDEEEIALAPGVSVVQKDIRMVQLAKSAVCAGMRTILETSGTEPAEVAALYIAGGFGAFLDKHSAARIGLYPAELEQKVRVLGNAALSGASMILRQKAFIGKTEAFAGNASVVELSGNPVFSEYYMEGMLF